MITVGIDSGIEFTKAVIMDGCSVLGYGIEVSGGAARNEAAEKAMDAALAQAGLGRGAVEKVVATGKGKYDVGFADERYTEVAALAKAAVFIEPKVTTIVNFGADEVLAAVLKDGGKVDEMVLNQKCSAGLGTFIRVMARRLELSLEDMSAADVSGDDVPVGDGCIVFAEMGALSMLNRGCSVQEVAGAVTKAAAVRAATVLNDIILQNNECVLFSGGLAKNDAFLKALYQRYPMQGTVVAKPEYIGAMGAALLAAE